MKKLLILALTSAFVAAANAAGDWFRVAVSGSTQITTDATWSTTPAAANVADGVISIDEDVDTALELTPDALSPDAQTNTVVTVAATFTAISDVPGNLTGATTALTVAKENNVDYYFYWDGDSWEKITTVSPTLNTPVTVRIELDNTSTTGTTATIKVDGTTVATVVKGTKTKVSGLAFAGTGKIGNINADYTKAYASYDTTYYASTADAVTAKGANSGDITLYDHGAGVQLPSDPNKYYYSKASGNNTILGVFPASGSGTAQDPYTIGNLEDLTAFRQYVAAGITTQGKTFTQTANIDMASAGAFAGIGTYDANPTNGVPFTGTYDGGNYKISNVTMTGRNYGGIFNQVNGGTIKNLTVENISTAATSGEFGYAIVGNAGNGATLENLTAAGAFLSAEKPGTHNMAGIIVRACGGGVSGTLITNCTNNATIYGDYTKLGGICALTQYKVSGGSVTFDGCVNNGTLVSARTSQANASSQITGIAGIVGYTADATVLKDCVNNGTITVALADQKVGELVGSGGVEANGSLTDAGGNKADATKKMVHTRGVVTGFQYATVDDGVATTVTSLAKGNTYLLEGNVAASETPVFTLAAKNDYIAFNTNGYMFAGMVAAGSGLVAKPTTSDAIITYTADDGYEVVSTAETTLVAVPQNCKASQLIDTSNRASKDLLRVFNKAAKKYYQWEYDGKGGWTPNNVVQDADNVVVTPAADTVDLTRGEAVWVTLTDTSKPIKLNAVYTDDPVEVAVSIGYNLVAPALKEDGKPFALSSLTVKNGGSFNDKDMIVIPGATAPINCVRKDNEWKVYRVSGTETPSGMPAGWGGIATGGKYEDAPAIPRGTGFFFVSKEEKTIEL